MSETRQLDHVEVMLPDQTIQVLVDEAMELGTQVAGTLRWHPAPFSICQEAQPR
jgi:hypothetical protein